MEELKLRKIFILALLTIFLLPTVNPVVAQSYGPAGINNNKGSGVIVDMTWATIYNISPQ